MTSGPVETVPVGAEYVEPPSPLRSAGRYWWIVVLLALIGGGAGVLYAQSRPNVVTAEARVGVGSGSLAAYQIPGFAQASADLASNYARYIDIGQFEPALKKALGPTAATVASISASPIPDANVIRIEATSPTAATSAAAAQTVALQLIAQVKNTGSQTTPADLLNQYNKLSTQVATAKASQQRAETSYAKARNAVGGSPVTSVTTPGATPATAAEKAADQAQAAQIAAEAKVSSLSVQQDAVRQLYVDLVNKPAAQSGLRLVAAGHATSNSQSAGVQRYGLAGAVAGLVLALIIASLIDRARLRRRGRRTARAVEADRSARAVEADRRAGGATAVGSPDPHTT